MQSNTEKAMLHKEFVNKAIKKKKDAERRSKRREEDFVDLLFDKDFSISKVVDSAYACEVSCTLA